MNRRWRTWVSEPWDATLNGTLHRRGYYIGDIDTPSKERAGYASDEDVATAQRIVDCVNALAGLRRPAVLRELLDLVPELIAALDQRLESPLSMDPKSLRALLARARCLLAGINEDDTDPSVTIVQ